MMKFGLYFYGKGRKALVDLKSGEILTTSEKGIQSWLLAYENNYTLELI